MLAILVGVVILYSVVFLLWRYALKQRSKKARETKRVETDEWLKGLLNPSVSLEKIVFSLKQMGCYPCNWGFICLFAIPDCSEPLMWQLVDVFVRNAEQHYKVLSPNCKNGDELVLHLCKELNILYGINARTKIKNSLMPEESKQKLLR